MARRIATVGYYVVLPNLYYRWTREFDLVTMPNGETREQMVDLMQGLSDRMVASDTETMHRAMADTTLGYALMLRVL